MPAAKALKRFSCSSLELLNLARLHLQADQLAPFISQVVQPFLAGLLHRRRQVTGANPRTNGAYNNCHTHRPLGLNLA